jgi:hypothetical protein
LKDGYVFLKEREQMREGMIVVPQADNSGNSLESVLNETMRDCIQAFGGCTVVPATGAWVGDDGQLYKEPVYQVVAAYDPSVQADALLRRFAVKAGSAGKQLAVYVRYASGSVEIISLVPTSVAA